MKSLLEENWIGILLPASRVLQIRDLMLLEFGQLASSPGVSRGEKFLDLYLLYKFSINVSVL